MLDAFFGTITRNKNLNASAKELLADQQRHILPSRSALRPETLTPWTSTQCHERMHSVKGGALTAMAKDTASRIAPLQSALNLETRKDDSRTLEETSIEEGEEAMEVDGGTTRIPPTIPTPALPELRKSKKTFLSQKTSKLES